LSNRTYIKRFLKRSFKRLCHPFKRSAQQVTSIHVEGGNDVRGVAVLKNELFVACLGSNTIQVFDCSPPFTHQEDIHVQGMDAASDIIACDKSSSLFIADMGRECAIWRVNLLAIKQIDKFLAVQWRPLSLSVYKSRLLITPDDGKSLYLYGDDGNEVHHIPLPSYMKARHAVEKTQNSYIVSHFNKNEDPDSITEVNVNGEVISSFKDDFDLIQFLTVLSDNNHLIIADCYNNRIILLKNSLQLKRILINSLHEKQPRRIRLTSSRLLAVCYYDSTDIDIFQV